MSKRIFHKHPGESLAAYRAFTVYRDMGGLNKGRRSLDRVGRLLYPGKVPGARKRGKLGMLERWSIRYRWVERAREYDYWIIREHGKPRRRLDFDAIAAGSRVVGVNTIRPGT
jgi:hypothetical protein